MQLEHDTTRLGCEGSVEDPRRPTGVRGREELLTSLAVSVVAYNEIALDEDTPLPNGRARKARWRTRLERS